MKELIQPTANLFKKLTEKFIWSQSLGPRQPWKLWVVGLPLLSSPLKYQPWFGLEPVP